jgi:hypothetical protein
MVMDKRGSFPAISLVLLVVLLALLSPSCDTCCPPKSDQVISTSDGSQVTIYSGTTISPCNCMSASYVPLASLPDQLCLPCNPDQAKASKCLYKNATAITAIDVAPDAVTLTPAALLHFKLPTVPWPGAMTLYIFQHDPAAACPNAWHPVSTGPATVQGTLDFANGKLNHTCIFVLVDLQGDFNAMGTLVEPPQFQDMETTNISGVLGNVLLTLDVVGSSTNPDLEGKRVTFVLVGVQADYSREQMLSLLVDLFPPGTMLLLHHEPDGNMVIWSDRQVVQFSCERVAW